MGVRNSRLRGFLVAGQVAVSVVLLICTATLVRNARAAAERTWALTQVDGNGAIIILEPVEITGVSCAWPRDIMAAVACACSA